ncbi:MAG: NADH-quinone oxidoreductase subunit NuoG [Chloroflexi bacterium]|nr:NADH-quinone oxidoreductase subunit NuoG [Chloroflexota bacterium]
MTASPPPSDLVTLTINGREVKVPKGTLVVEAAKTVGIEIPIFCYHPKLKPVGACRMCLVEIEKMPRLQTACTSPVGEGMVVNSASPNVIAAQNGVLELLLANHPLDCPICDKGGECPLQDNTFKFGLGASRFTEEKRQKDKAYILSDRIVLDRERCIMCYRCVRFQAEIPGDEALAAVDRGGFSEIGVLEGDTFDSPFSGNTIELCPVGALTSRQYRFKSRPWDLQRTPSICAGCSLGCNTEIHARDGQILRLWGRDNPAVNDGWLSDHDRFDTLPLLRDKRLATPLVRQGGRLQPASWEAAYSRAAELLKGGNSAALASPKLTNEAMWLVADGLRAALPGLSVGFTPRAAPSWTVTGKVADLPSCKTIVLVGFDPWTEVSVLALWLRKAVVGGGTLLAIGPDNGLYRDTAHWLRVAAGEEIGVVEKLLAAHEAGTQADRFDAVTGRQANAGTAPTDKAIAAAAAAVGTGPVAFLVGARLADDAKARATLEKLAAALGANAESGMVGAPSTTVNGRGALNLAGDIVAADRTSDGAAGRAAGGAFSTVLLLGDEAWPATGAAKKIVLTAGAAPEDDSVEVVLPIAHPYEQAGSYTNLEGLVQQLQPGGLPPHGVSADWATIAALVQRLGGSAPTDLKSIRSALAGAHPSYTITETRTGRQGRLMLPLA